MNINSKAKGSVCEAVAVATYGMSPLSTLPLYKEGILADSVLFYRYGFAVPILGILTKVQGRSFTLRRNEILPSVAGGLLFSAFSLLLFLSYKHMDTGIVSTILSIYPVMMAPIMFLFFHEKVSLLTVFCILLALPGIGLLYKGGGGETLSLVDMLSVILSSLSYATYIIGVSHPTLRLISTAKLTFYALLFGSSIYIVHLSLCADLRVVPSFPAWGNILAIASLPTVISLVCTAVSIHNIDSTPITILGALEPATVPFLGVMISDEWLIPKLTLGILMILVVAMFIVMDKLLMTFIKGELVRGIKKKLIR